ncbi:replication protein RepA [Lamprobacter modestohalophilus]|uniref:replication protein RepA n=1 Tax=Lamprobacter modestohalophilus TaxID=1064514 RepID=UPI001908860B
MHLKLIEAADEIEQDQPSEQDAAYLARELVQCTLPHKDPGNVPLWKRNNGNLTLAIQPGYEIQTSETYGYPDGTIPHLLLFWITTEALRKQNQRLELGNSLAGFMRELGLDPSRGGARSDSHRLREAVNMNAVSPARHLGKIVLHLLSHPAGIDKDRPRVLHRHHGRSP